MKKLLLFACILLFVTGCNWLNKDDCFDRGGAWDSATKTCDLEDKPTYEVQEIHEKGDGYSIDIMYPNLKNKDLDAQVLTLYKASLENFRLELKNLKPVVGFNWILDGTVEIVFEDEEKISLIYNWYEFFGGAHGNSHSKTIIWDKKNNKSLALNDIVSNFDEKKLKRISVLVAQKLTEQMEGADTDWITEGTTPKLENYQRFLLKNEDRVSFYFPPYQVGPYSSGPQMVTINLADLN